MQEVGLMIESITDEQLDKLADEARELIRDTYQEWYNIPQFVETEEDERKVNAARLTILQKLLLKPELAKIYLELDYNALMFLMDVYANLKERMLPEAKIKECLKDTVLAQKRLALGEPDSNIREFLQYLDKKHGFTH